MNLNATPIRPSRLAALHRWAGLFAAPFLTLSLVLALGLTHPATLHALSARLLPSLSIPPVALAEPAQPGSVDQAVALVTQAHGTRPTVVVLDRAGQARIGGFSGEHRHGTNGQPRHATYVVDTRRQAIVRVEDAGNSLFIMGHGIHAYQFFGIDGFNLASVTALCLLVLLASGAALALRNRRIDRARQRPVRVHAWVGLVTGAFTLVVAATTLMFDFPALAPDRDLPSLPIPAVALGEPVQPGSLDQAARLAERVLGHPPRSYYLRPNGKIKLAGFGDDIDGAALVVDGRSMRILRLEDWRNNPLTAAFIVHDGRYLGGLDGFNIMDAYALAMLYLTWGGVILALRRRRAGSE